MPILPPHPALSSSWSEDQFEKYETRNQLLDNDFEIKPGKWQLQFNQFRLVGLNFPIGEFYTLEENGLGSSQVISHAVEVATHKIQIKTFDPTPTYAEIQTLHSELYSYLQKSDEAINTYGIYSLTRFRSVDLYSTNWILRGAKIPVNRQILRHLKIEKILNGESQF